MERHGWIDAGLAKKLRDMARFRNLLVHGYAKVNLDRVEDIVRNHLRDLEALVAAVRKRILA